MKKLMVTALAMVAAAITHAATVEWEAGDIFAYGTGDYASNYLVYYIDAADYAYDAAQADLANKDITFLGTYGKVADGMEDGAAWGAVEGYDNGATITAYAVVLNANSIESATYAFLSAADEQATGSSGQSASMFFDTADSSNAANWSSIGGEVIPEPTSGLLLLVGMAGLALRRRRA